MEAASNAVARGNLKVFAEIGYEFARYLSGEEFAVQEPHFPLIFFRFHLGFGRGIPA